MIYFLVYLFLEIFVSIEFASYLGALYTFIEVIVSALIGIFIIVNFKYSFLESLTSLIKQEITQQEFISMHIFSIIGAIFLILPGFLLDIIGLLMQFEFFATIVSSKFIHKKFDTKFNHKTRGDGNVIDVEVIERN
ncbi:MAG: FxsA family protein [Campylobacterales bacterium]|nr:FxsA family protein [Campylobacterales bacterium]